jgi:hypothetical protein
VHIHKKISACKKLSQKSQLFAKKGDYISEGADHVWREKSARESFLFELNKTYSQGLPKFWESLAFFRKNAEFKKYSLKNARKSGTIY